MYSMTRWVVSVGVVVSVGLLAGCQSTERANVRFSYVVEPERSLPAGLETVAILPAKIGPTTDEKWSDLCVTVLQSLVNESRDRFGTPISVSDRRDTQVTFDEADLAAAGMSTKRGGSGGKLLAAQAAILSNINVKVERHVGRERTISGIDIGALTGRNWRGDRVRGGHAAVQTDEVETVTRNMTVQSEFKLVDTADNRVLAHYSPAPYRATDRTHASAFFGSSQTEASLTPRDRIIGTLVEKAAREFVSQLMPCRVDVNTVVVSSGQESCVRGVKLLRGELYGEAIEAFENALAGNPDDHRAAYGAGIACEASGRYEKAMDHFRRACTGEENMEYREALDRVKAYGHRVRQ